MMLRYLLAAPFTLALLALARPAFAWDSSALQYAPADGEMPGGGGIIGTGSRTDDLTECGHCHIEPEQRIDLTFTPTPAFDAVGETIFYEPGRVYEFRVVMTGETLGLSGCPNGVVNANMIAATFEDLNGANVGLLRSDSGQTQGSACPSERPDPDSLSGGTTLLFGDCRVLFTRDALPGDATEWWFRWTAPPAGTGDVVLYGGGVDSNCDMTSLGDDVKMVKLTLSDGSTRAGLSPARRGSAMFAVASPSPLEWGGLDALVTALSALGVRVARRRRTR